MERSACLQRIRRDKRLKKRFSGRLVLERSRSNGGLFSCCMLDGWKTMKQREAGTLIFFWLEAGQPASHQSSRAISRTSETHPSARRKDLQERIAGMHGITAKPSLSRYRAALQLVASGYDQGGCGWLRRRQRQGWLLGEKGGAGCTGHK